MKRHTLTSTKLLRDNAITNFLNRTLELGYEPTWLGRLLGDKPRTAVFYYHDCNWFRESGSLVTDIDEILWLDARLRECEFERARTDFR